MAAYAELDGLRVDLYRSDIDGKLIVRIDTTDDDLHTTLHVDGTPDIRVYINDDGCVYGRKER